MFKAFQSRDQSCVQVWAEELALNFLSFELIQTYIFFIHTIRNGRATFDTSNVLCYAFPLQGCFQECIKLAPGSKAYCEDNCASFCANKDAPPEPEAK